MHDQCTSWYFAVPSQAAAAKSGDFEAEALGLKVKVQALTRDVKAARADSAASAKALEAAKTECAKLQVIADERAASLAAIKQELQDERATVATLRDTIASAATSSAAGEQELATVTQQLAEAQARADAAEARAATQDDLISTLQRSEAELKARVESTDGDFAALREELAAAKEAAVASQDELDEMTALYNAANKKSRSLSKRMAKLLQVCVHVHVCACACVCVCVCVGGSKELTVPRLRAGIDATAWDGGDSARKEPAAGCHPGRKAGGTTATRGAR